MLYRILMMSMCGLIATARADELTLDRALELAEQQATQLQLLAAETDLAKATHTRTAQAFLPTISADATWLRADASLLDDVPVPALDPKLPEGLITYQDLGPVDVAVRGLQVVQPLFNMDAWKSRKQAEHQVTGRRQSYEWGNRLMRVQVVKQYYAVTVRTKQEKAARMALEAARQARQMAEAAYAEGLVAKLDVARAEAEVKGRKASVSVAKAAVQRVRSELKTLLGLPLGKPVTLVSSFPALAPPPGTTIASEERSDHLARQAKLEAARAGLEKAKARWLPRANLLARQQWADGNDPYDMHGDSWIVALQLQWTLFEGLGRKGEIAEARARKERARIQVEQSRRAVAKQQQLAISDWEATWAAQLASEQAVEAALEAMTLAQRQYEEGVGNMSDVLATQATLYQRRLEHSRFQFNALEASMHYYLHHGLDPLMILPERGKER